LPTDHQAADRHPGRADIQAVPIGGRAGGLDHDPDDRNTEVKLRDGATTVVGK